MINIEVKNLQLMDKRNEVSKIVKIVFGKYFLHFHLDENITDILERPNPAVTTVRIICKGYMNVY
jgi:hypothetical protein